MTSQVAHQIEQREFLLAGRWRASSEHTEVIYPFDPATRVGPLIDEAAARRVEAWVREAVEGGATLCTGGQRTGPYLEPTVLTGVTLGMKVSCGVKYAIEEFTEPRLLALNLS
jgi:acyl-CoA reductase-like NAD-dependent aldehyde dehydrogenase